MKPFVILVGADQSPPREEPQWVPALTYDFHGPQLPKYMEHAAPILLTSNQVRYMNGLSPLVLCYKIERDELYVYAWTSDLDENGGNLKGRIPRAFFNRNFPNIVPVRLYRGDKFRVEKGQL